MNKENKTDLVETIDKSQKIKLKPLIMKARNTNNVII